MNNTLLFNIAKRCGRIFRALAFRPFNYIRIRSYLKTNEIKKLHIGAGKNILKGWLNADIKASLKTVYLDASKKFPFKNNTFDYIFSEHLIEHLDYKGGINMLSECYRIWGYNETFNP